MKRLTVIIFILLIGGMANHSLAQKKGRAIVCFQSDMDCSNCEIALYEHLKFEKGVKDLKIDHVSNTIFIEYSNKKNDESALARSIRDMGYKAVKIDYETYKTITNQPKEQSHEHNHEVHKDRD